MLRRVPGYAVIADRDEWVFAARGNVADNNQSYLILIDGHRVNSNENFGPGQIIELPNDLSNVSRIEIIRGPGSAVWGADALAGVINIITLTASELGDNRHNVGVGIGQDETYKANFQFGQELGDDVDFVVSGSFARQGGHEITQSAATTLPIFKEETDYSTHPFGTYTTALEKHDPSYMIYLKGRAGNLGVNAMAFNTSVFNRHFEIGHGRENYLTTYKAFVEGVYETSAGRGYNVCWKMSSDVNRSEYFPKEQGDSEKLPFNIVWLDRRFNTSLDLGKEWGPKTALACGVDYSFTRMGPNQRINGIDPNESRDPTTGFWFDQYLEDHSVGGYLMLNLRPTEPVKLIFGSRVDYNDDRGTDKISVSPRVGAVLQVGRATYLKALYNRGFLRPANFQSTGAEVESQTMDQVDLVWLQQFRGGDLGITVYWQKLRGFINILSGANYQGFANAGDNESRGIELNSALPITDRLSLWANATYAVTEASNFPEDLPLNSRRVNPDGRILSYPGIMFNTGCTAHLSRKLSLSPAIRFTGEADYRSSPPTNSVDDATYETAGPFTYLDLSARYQVSSNLQLSLYVDNLTDVTEETHLSIWNGTIEQYGRYVQGTVRMSW